MKDESKNEELKQIFGKAFLHYLDKYFKERNLEETIKLLSENITGFGTGIDEVAYSKGSFAELYKRDIDNVPDEIDYQFQDKEIILISEKVALAFGRLNIKGEAAGQKFALNHLRLSLLLVLRDDGRVLIEHKHISFPTDVHEEGEAYPLKEIEDITKKLDSMVKEKTRTIMEAYKELEISVVTDKLTSLYNRNRLDEILENEINRCNRYNKRFSLLIMDIDRFKYINDNFGHVCGDKVLKKTAAEIKKCIRNTDFAGRWGGDELIIIFPETYVQAAVDIAEKLRLSIAHLDIKEDFKLSASFGVAEFLHGDTAEGLFRRADKALYLAKSTGRNRVISSNQA